METAAKLPDYLTTELLRLQINAGDARMRLLAALNDLSVMHHELERLIRLSKGELK